MLIHGGMTYRNRNFTQIDGTTLDVFNHCEQLTEADDEGNKPYYLRTCGEEILNDLWFYQIEQNRWFFVKETFNADVYIYVKKPAARYAHCGSYIQLKDMNTYFADGLTPVLRKYLYVYGGFSYECHTACSDLWRYEIPYAPYLYFPAKLGSWVSQANHWTMLSDGSVYGPGPRVKSSMTSVQPELWLESVKTGDYLYIFGGILV
jgi:hypothetical protein